MDPPFHLQLHLSLIGSRSGSLIQSFECLFLNKTYTNTVGQRPKVVDSSNEKAFYTRLHGRLGPQAPGSERIGWWPRGPLGGERPGPGVRATRWAMEVSGRDGRRPYRGRSRAMNVGHRVARWPDRDWSKILPARRPRADSRARTAHGARHTSQGDQPRPGERADREAVAKRKGGGEERRAVVCSGPWRWRHKTRSTSTYGLW